MNYFMARGMGGDDSPAGGRGVDVAIGPADTDALKAYLRSLPSPLDYRPTGGPGGRQNF